MYQWDSAWQSHKGNRRKSNEDSVLARPDVGLWVVADGMGGHMAGDVASQAITDALAGVKLEGVLTEDVDRVEDTLVAVNDELRLHAQTRCQGGTVGSTVVTLLVRDEVGVVLWAGDSRLFVWWFAVVMSRVRRSRFEFYGGALWPAIRPHPDPCEG